MADQTRSWIVSFLLYAGLLSLCLFAPSDSPQSSSGDGLLHRELLAAFRHPGTLRMVFICCCFYFGIFILLEHRSGVLDFWRLHNPSFWLSATVIFAGLRYACCRDSASGNTDALVVLAGAAIGKGGAAWARWRMSAIEEDSKRIAITALVLLLVAAVFVTNSEGMQYQYRGQNRWSGPWDNPNAFGILMGLGFVLAAGQIHSLLADHFSRTQASGSRSEVSEQMADARGKTLNVGFGIPKAESRNLKRERWHWIRVVLLAAAAIVCGIGLVKSYSRGAWLGTVSALVYLGWTLRRNETHLVGALNSTHLQPSGTFSPFDAEKKEPSGERDCPWCHSCVSRFYRNSLGLCVVLLSLITLAFWNLRHTERTTARRAFSVANVNDFSWRKRVAAYEGAFQMMANKPVIGFGWSRPERVYDGFYRASKVDEGMAFQLNDYFTLGTTLGIPALVCFLVYTGLSLIGNCKQQTSASPWSFPQSGEVTSSPATWRLLPAMICRVGAIVLLVGFWFDGGLLRLATGSMFWILMELGQER